MATSITYAEHRREIAEFNKLYTNLRNSLKKAETKCEIQTKDLNNLRKIAAQNEKESKFLKKVLDKCRNDNSKLGLAAKKNRDYATKLEKKLGKGGKTRYLADKNIHLRQQINALTEKIEQQNNIMKSQETDLHRAADEIEILARALEVRAEDIGDGVDGSLRSALLYEVAQKQQENHRLGLDLANKNERLKELDSEAELAIAAGQELRDRCNELELRYDAVETKAHNEVNEKIELQKKLSEYQQERNVMLDFIQESAEKTAELQQNIDNSTIKYQNLENILKNLSDEHINKIENFKIKNNNLNNEKNAIVEALAIERKSKNEYESAINAGEKLRIAQQNEINNLHSEIDKFTEINARYIILYVYIYNMCIYVYTPA